MRNLAILALTLFLVQTKLAFVAKLHVGIFYESLCPDSIRFIQNQLSPTYNDLRDHIEILFVPFGKSYSVNGGENFVCQHGPNECYGNMIQSCVLNELTDQDNQVSYVGCQMSFAAELLGKECATAHSVPWETVSNCYNDGLGRNLQLQAEELTNALSPTFVPTIVYNHQFNQVLQDRSQVEFKKVVCELINNAAVTCEQYKNSAKRSF